MRIVAIAAVACAWLALAGGAAAAQDTGGSMGGGDFSDTSSSSSSSSSDYSSSDTSYTPSYSYDSSNYDYDSSSHSYSSGSRHGSSSAGAEIAAVIIFLVFAGITWIAKNTNVYRTGSGPMPAYDPNAPAVIPGRGHGADITVLRVAVDARARKFIQAELARIASVAKTDTADGRAAMLREVALLLRRLKDSWLYGGAHNEPMMSLGEAQAVFQRHVGDARARFTHELVRNAQGQVTRGVAPDSVATSDEGPGVMLVTVVVAARHELFTINRVGDGEDLRKAFEALSNMVPGELVAVEVVWMPAADADRMSSIELEAAYPRPDLIPIQGALVGKVFCTYCGAPYPAEAIACPNCGGRAAA